MTPIEQVLGKARGVRPQGKGWVAYCPACSNRYKSPSIVGSDDSMVLPHHYCVCTTDPIVVTPSMRSAGLKPAWPTLVMLAGMSPSDVKWLWPSRIPLGCITLLIGSSSEDKSALTYNMAARISAGKLWPDWSPCPSGSVLFISDDCRPSDTIRPQLDAHGADLRKVHLLSAVRRTGADGKPYEAMFTLSDVANLEAALKKLPDCRLIVVDPVESFIENSFDPRNGKDILRGLTPVSRLTERYGVAMVVVCHQLMGAGGNQSRLRHFRPRAC